MRVVVPLGFSVLAVLQATWLPHLRVAGVMPDAVLVAVVTWAILLGGVAAVPLAAGSGLLLDLIAGTPLGLSAAAMLVAVLATGWWHGTVFYTGIGVFIVAAIIATVAYDGTLLVGLQTFHETVSWPEALRGVVAPSAALNGILAVPLAYIIGWVANRLGLVTAP